MKCVLAAAPEVKGGLVRENILVEIEKLVGKKREKIKVAIIPDASANDEKSTWWQIEFLKSISDTFPKNTWLLNIFVLTKPQLKKLIDNVDVIWCCGGNPDYLIEILKKCDFDKMFPQMLETKVWVGSSGGSMIMGKRGTTKTLQVLGESKMKREGVCYLELVDACIYPHIYEDKAYSDTIDENIQKIVVAESKKQNYPIYALSYDGAVIVDGDKTYMVGTNCQKIYKGRIIEQI